MGQRPVATIDDVTRIAREGYDFVPVDFRHIQPALADREYRAEA